MSGSPPRRLPWWFWLAIAAAVLGCAFVALRLHGWMRLRHTTREIQALGMPTDPAGYWAEIPQRDEPDQQQFDLVLSRMSHASWWEWKQGCPRWELQEESAFYANRSQAARKTALVEGAADMAELLQIIGRGRVWFGFVGILPPDHRQWNRERLTFHASENWRIWGLRSCLNWLIVAAEERDDPRAMMQAAFGILDQQVRPCSQIDAMMGIAAQAIIDGGMLRLASRGRLPDDLLNDWLHRPPKAFEFLASSIRGERCLFLALDDNGRNIPIPDEFDARMWNDFAGSLLIPDHIASANLAKQAILELQARQQPTPDWATGTPGGLASGLVNDSAECLVTAAEADLAHRIRCPVAVIASRYRKGITVPADRTELASLLPAKFLDAQHPDSPALQYERLSPSRIRIGLDPALPRPAAFPADRWSKPGYASSIGQPAATKSEVWNRLSYEVDLDAILVPPPPPKRKP